MEELTTQEILTQETTSSEEISETSENTEEEVLLVEEAVDDVELKEDFIHPQRSELRNQAETKLIAFETELLKINSLDPSIKSFDDLMNMENSKEFAEKVKRGYTLTDAFIIVNGKKLSERLKASAVRSALAKQGSRHHLTGTLSGGTEAAVDVPSETYSLYKALYPNITDQEIRKHYKKSKRN